MNIVILNGSPRKGNTVTAIDTIVKNLKAEHTAEVIDTYKLNIAPCKACMACGCANGCIDKDDTNPTVDKLVAADMIIFATPVYWWGITAQMKMVVDKCYCKARNMKNKKIGVIAVGGAAVGSEQYTLIERQFTLICNYLGWDLKFCKAISANAKDALSQNEEDIKALAAIGAEL